VRPQFETLEQRLLLDAGDDLLVPPGATWNYLDDGTDQGVAWREMSFDDSAWASGPAELGYGDGDEATVLKLTPIYPCYYFRHGFEVTDLAAYESLALNIIRDDGAVAYLNGQEVARSNMPAGEITYDTWSATVVGGDDPDERTWHEFAVDAGLLVSGTNVVAVEVHQCHATSSDVSFNLELAGVPAIPTVALTSPADQSVVNHTEVSFTCSATDDVDLADATLYVGTAPQTVTFSGSADTDDSQISADQPDVNFGSEISINVDGANPHAHGVIKFPDMFGDGPGQVPLGSTIVSASATLEVNCTNAGNPIELYRLIEDWNEGEVTWNERASDVPWTNAGADGIGSHAGVALDGYCSSVGTQSFDITPFVQQWSDGAANYGIVMTDSGNDGIDFDSSESGQPPVFTVTYGTPKEAIETKPLSGTSDTATFTTTLSDDGDYLWNCLVTNTSAQQSWAPADFLLRVDTNSPDQPVLVAPADGATGVSTSPMLEVTASDPNGDPLDVTFYGGEDSAGEDFTIVVLPDTQKYSQSYPDIFTAQTQWIADNVDALNTVFVTHEGDIVQTWDNTTEWERADTSMSLLDGVVPYGVLPGNHDQPTTYYNQYFPYARYESQPWYGGHYGNTNDNNYQLFSAGGDDYVILHIEYAPSSEVITWADSVLETYVDRKAIITTHSYLDVDGSRTTTGNTIWNDLVVPNDNVYFVLCGHMHDEYTRTDVVNGREVHQLLADYQGYTNGGNGWLRTMRFAPGEDTVYVETYSPWLDQYETDTDSRFTLDFDMAGFSVIGTDMGVASGSNASVVWADLSMDAQYDWYVTVTDTSARTMTGPTWSFTTGTNQPPVAVDDVAYRVDEDNTLTVPVPGVLGNDSDPEGDLLTAILVSDVSNGSLSLNSDGSFDYTPSLNFNGSDSFTYKANDGTSDSNTATVTINPPPVPPGVWDGGTGNWAAANWSGSQAPAADTPMIIDAAGDDSVVTVAANFITGGTGPAASLAIGATNTASLTVNGGITLEVTGDVDIGGSGTMLVNGTLNTAGVTVAGGATLGGGGTIGGAVNVNTGGTVAPGASVGTLTVNNDLTFADGGNTWVAELLGAGDRVDVTGTLTLGDATALEFVLDAANPFQAGSYTLATYDTLAGTFSSVTDLGAYSTGVVYGTGTSDAITIDVSHGLVAGDATLDRKVDLDDFARLRNNFGTGDTWAEADFNGDDAVNLNDFAILRNNFGSSAPEPATLAILAMGGGMAVGGPEALPLAAAEPVSALTDSPETALLAEAAEEPPHAAETETPAGRAPFQHDDDFQAALAAESAIRNPQSAIRSLADGSRLKGAQHAGLPSGSDAPKQSATDIDLAAGSSLLDPLALPALNVRL